MEKSHHAQSHLKFKIDIKEDELDDNANYWKGSALWNFIKVKGILFPEKKKEFKSIKTITWKDLCLTLEKIIEELEKK